VTDLDPDHVQVVTAQVHDIWCLPGAVPMSRYSKKHLDVDARLAEWLLIGLDNAGYTLTTKEEAR
jgi:hypothetical protein